MGILDAIFGDTVRENHEDGSYTDRSDFKQTSITKNSDDEIIERTSVETSFGGFGRTHVKTYDGDDNLINIQRKK